MFEYHSDHHWDCFQFGAIMSKAVIIFLEIFGICIYTVLLDIHLRVEL